MPVCSFCKNAYEFPRGTTVVQKDNSVKYFCSSKCRKNMEMGRLTKKVKWIAKSDVVKTEKIKREADWKARQEAAAEAVQKSVPSKKKTKAPASSSKK